MKDQPIRRSLVRVAAFACALFAVAGAHAHPPYGLATDARGNIYFSDLEAVWRLTPAGRLELFRARSGDTHVHEVVVAPDGAVEGDLNHYDPATGRFYTGLWRRTSDARETMPVPMTEDAPDGFGLWQDGRGNRYASHWPSNEDRRTILTRRSPDGRSKIVFAEGRPGAARKGSVAGVGGMAFGADGAVYFADRNLLRRLGPDGRTVLVFQAPAGSSLRGLAVARDGRILAADMGLKSVIAVAADGRVETLYREMEAWLPTAVAAFGGRLLVLEANADPRDQTNRVRVIRVDEKGRSEVVAMPGGASAKARPETPSTDAPPRVPPAAIAGAVAVAAAAAAGLWIRRRR
jgi:hypothetical protein